MRVRPAKGSLDLSADPVKLAPVTVEVYQVDQIGSEPLHLLLLYPEHLPGSYPRCHSINLSDIPPYPLPEAFRTYHVREMLPI